MSEPTTRRWLGDAALVLLGRGGAAAFELAVLAVAAHQVSDEDLGLVFLAQAGAVATGAVAGLGLHVAVLRRSARDGMSRHLLLRVTALRAAAFAAAGAVAWGLGLAADVPAVLVAAFVLGYGLEEVHGPARMVVLGQARFGTDVRVMLAGRGVGSVAAIVGLVAGGGLWGWCLARLGGELLFLGLATAAAARALPAEGGPLVGGLLRESRPFWLMDLVALASGRVHAFLVAAVLGLGAAAAHGVAWRVIGGALLVVGSLVSAAFPRWSRRRRGGVSRRDLAVFLALGAAVGAGLVVGAPFVAAVLLPSDAETVSLLIRVMAVAAVAAALHEPLQAWLIGRDRERVTALGRLAAGAAGLAALVPLLSSWDLVGGAVGLSLEHVIVLSTLGLVAWRSRSGSTPRPP